MADPLSIAAGVVGILASLTALSMRVQEFRKDFKESSTEIRQLTREISDLTLILGRLDEARSSLSLPHKLGDDLRSVLQDLNSVIVEADIHLRKASERKLRGAYWAFTGKKECVELCRGLESHKSTLNLALTLSSVISNHQIQNQSSQILVEVENIKTKLPGDNYILRRFLEDTTNYAETEYDGATVIESTEPNTANLLNSDIVRKNPKVSQSTELSSRLSNQHSLGVSTAKKAVDFWKEANGGAQAYAGNSYPHKMPTGYLFPKGKSRNTLIAARGNNVAICTSSPDIRNSESETFGQLCAGTPSKLSTLDLRLDTHKPPEPSNWNRSIQIEDLVFQESGDLVSVWRYRLAQESDGVERNRYVIVHWTKGIDSPPKLTTSLCPILSESAKYYVEENVKDTSLEVLELTNSTSMSIIKPSAPVSTHPQSIMISESVGRLLVKCKSGVSSYTYYSYDITNGALIFQVTPADLSITNPSIDFGHVYVRHTGVPDMLGVVYDAPVSFWDDSKTSKIKKALMRHPPFPPKTNYSFVELAHLHHMSEATAHWTPKYHRIVFAGDGSCFAAMVDSRRLAIVDIETGKAVKELDFTRHMLDVQFKFQAGGRRLVGYCADEGQEMGYQVILVWRAD